MARSIGRRAFLKGAGATAAALVGGPLVRPTRATGQGRERLVVAVGQWGTETPFAWRTVQAEKPLWDCMYDPLIMRDPKTFEYRPGLATEWKASNELKTWTCKLRSGVKFHEGGGELTAEDVKFTVEQNLKPDSGGGSAPFFRTNLDRIETPDKLTVVLHFKNRVWEVASNFTQFDVEERARLTHALGHKLYDAYHGVMLGTKSVTWAMSRKVRSWQSLAYVPMETNYEYVSPAG